jgi:copper(I)-binding protein
MRIISTAILALASFASPAAQPSLDVEVTEAWIRWLPANLPGAGYMTLTNKGPVAEVLIGASSPDYGQITLHRTRTVQGLSGMVPLDSVTVAAHTSVDFAAHGYHMMLAQGRRPLHSGDRVPVTLRFASGQSMIASFEIRADAAAN